MSRGRIFLIWDHREHPLASDMEAFCFLHPGTKSEVDLGTFSAPTPHPKSVRDNQVWGEYVVYGHEFAQPGRYPLAGFVWVVQPTG